MKANTKWLVMIGMVICVGCGSAVGPLSHLDTGGVVAPTIKSAAAQQLQPISAADWTARIRQQRLDAMNASTTNCYTQSEVMTGSAPSVSAAPSPNVMAASSASGSSVTFTDTNNQEAAVEESDIIKVRGDYAYVLSDGKLRTDRVWPLAQFGSVDAIAIEGTPLGLLADEHSLVVLSQVNVSQAQLTKLTIFSLRDPSHPALIRETSYEGTLIASRRIADRVVLALRAAARGETTPTYGPCDVTTDANTTTTRVAAANSLRTEDLLPRVRRGDKSAPLTVLPVQSVYAATPFPTHNGLLEIVTTDLNHPEVDDHTAAIMAAAETVYVSEHALYATESTVADTSVEATAIHQFVIDGDAPEYHGTGVVAGRLLNQFSLSEFENVLRVATTSGHATKQQSGSESQVYTLDATTPTLPQLGAVGGLGKNEQIYAVRFIGPRGYVVTFKKIDPLFVLDLEDAAHPSVAGELKVPGYSTYLHPMNDGAQLLGIGKDADDQGSFAWYQGVKLSLFDVSDPANPSEQQKIVIGGRGTDSPALQNHLAFTYDESRQLLALPIHLVDGKSGTGSQGGKFAYDGLQLYHVSADTGFTLAGEVKDVVSGYGPIGTVQRSVVYGDTASSAVLILRAHNLEAFQIGDTMTSIGKDVWAADANAVLDCSIMHCYL